MYLMCIVLANYPIAFVADPFVSGLSGYRVHIVVGRVHVALGLSEPQRRVHLGEVRAATARR